VVVYLVVPGKLRAVPTKSKHKNLSWPRRSGCTWPQRAVRRDQTRRTAKIFGQSPSYLYRWRDFADLSSPREWVAGVVARPSLFPKFLKAFVQTGQAWTLGDYVSHAMVSFQLRDVMPIVELPALVALCVFCRRTSRHRSERPATSSSRRRTPLERNMLTVQQLRHGDDQSKCSMSKEAANHHRRASEHHTNAARHHQEAA
jgi:hypothetical protein